MRPTSPLLSRKATRSSPRSRTFFGGQSGAGSSEEGMHGIQYWRRRLPMGVPRPTRHISSLSSLESIGVLLSNEPRASLPHGEGHADARARLGPVAGHVVHELHVQVLDGAGGGE